MNFSGFAWVPNLFPEQISGLHKLSRVFQSSDRPVPRALEPHLSKINNSPNPSCLPLASLHHGLPHNCSQPCRNPPCVKQAAPTLHQALCCLLCRLPIVQKDANAVARAINPSPALLDALEQSHPRLCCQLRRFLQTLIRGNKDIQAPVVEQNPVPPAACPPASDCLRTPQPGPLLMPAPWWLSGPPWFS